MMETYFDYQKAVFNSNLSTNARITALAIASHFNFADPNPVWPSRKRLSSQTGLSLSSIDRAKDELVDKGWMTYTRRFDKTNLYVPAIPESRRTEDPSVTQTPPMRHSDATLASHRRSNSPLNYPLNREEEGVIVQDPFLFVSSDQTLPEAETGEARSLKQEEVLSTTHLPLVSNAEKAGELKDLSLVLKEVNPGDLEYKRTPVWVPSSMRREIGTIPQAAFDIWN